MKTLLVIAVALALGASLSVKAADAKETWKAQCAKCHGENGKGDTKMGKKLGVKDYTDPKVQAEAKDEAMAKAIKEGVKQDEKTLMKAFGDSLSDDEIKALVAHVRSFKK